MIPEKYFYTIGDVCRITGTKPHILRYWESQFKLLKPARRYSGHRKYTQRDIDLVNKIRHLIIDRRFTLAGAKREMNRLATENSPTDIRNAPNKTVVSTLLQDLRREVDSCLDMLGPPQELAKESDLNKRSLF